MRVATWYVDRRRLNHGHLDLIQQVNPDILAVQGLKQAGFDRITESKRFDQGRFSFDLTNEEYAAKEHGVAIFVKHPYTIKHVCLISDMPPNAKAIAAEVMKDDRVFVVASVDIPNGSEYKEQKALALFALMRWVKERKEMPTLGGIKYTGPEVDHPDLSKVQFWGDVDTEGGKALIHGDATLFKDAYRDYLDQRSDLKQEIVKKSPQGPLAMTYKSPKKSNPYRYDYIFKSPHFEVEYMEHLWEKSQSLSTHALVYTDLKWLK
jgi:endonuclease/exonuclease/phosphatase family metal-dependent hydrolase